MSTKSICICISNTSVRYSAQHCLMACDFERVYFGQPSGMTVTGNN